MTQTQEITEVNLPVPEPLGVRLLLGKFYISRHGDTWCCFNYKVVNDQLIYNCVRQEDNFIGQFKGDGHLRFQSTDGTDDEDTLIEAAGDDVTAISALPPAAPFGSQHNRLLTKVDSLITKAGEIADLVQSQASDLAESNFRLSYIRELLGKLANDRAPDMQGIHTTVAIAAQDALLWLAGRELNERKLGLPL